LSFVANAQEKFANCVLIQMGRNFPLFLPKFPTGGGGGKFPTG